MGHSSTEMLFRVYSRYVPDITRQDGSAMDNLLLASKEKLTSASNSFETEETATSAQTDKETSL